jgi:serine/threonine protein kinase
MFGIFGKRPPQGGKSSSAVAAADFRPGSKLGGRFHVFRSFEGGLGVVCVVEDLSHRPTQGSNVFVLKFPKLLDHGQEAAFRREASVWVMLGRHPAIIPALWVDFVGSRLCVAAEFIPPDAAGRSTLRDHLQGKPKPLRQVVRWTHQFLSGMLHAVDRGMTSHGDVKPENLMVSPDGDLQITDFGLAKSIYEREPTRGGTPAYMPSEQWLGGMLDQRSDLYAFGLILFELCFGRLPFPMGSVPALRDQHLRATFDIPAHPLKSLVSALLKADRDQRPTLAEAMSLLEDAALRNGIVLQKPIPPSDFDRREELRAQSSIEGPNGIRSTFEAALELTRCWPDDASAWTQLGRLYLSVDDVPQAHAATARSISLDDTRSAPWNNLGIIWSRLGEPHKAILAYRRALECDPDNTGTMLNMAAPLAAVGQLKEAIVVLNGAIALAPDKVAVWVSLSGCLWEDGQRREAIQALRKACDLAPPSMRPQLDQQLAQWNKASGAG